MRGIRVFGQNAFRSIGQSGGSAIIYLLRDEFTTAQSAPLSTPANCEPGPGTRIRQADTGNNVSIAAGKQVWAGGTGTYANTAYRWADNAGNGFARVTGRTFVVAINYDAVNLGFIYGLWPTSTINTTPDHTLFKTTSKLQATTAAAIPDNVTLTQSTDYKLAHVLRSTGCFNLLFDGTNWINTWIDVSGTTTPVYPGLIENNNAAHVDWIRIADLSGFSDYSWATLHQTTGLTSGANFAGDADGIHDLVFTGPGSPALNDTIELRFNVSDASNYNTAYMVRTAVPDWSFKMDTVAAGTPTNRISVTGIATLPDRIRVIGFGNLRNCYTLSGTTWTSRGAQVNVSNQNTSTLTNTTFTGAQFTPTALDSFPRTSSSYNVLSSI